jgi:hypothetical protein
MSFLKKLLGWRKKVAEDKTSEPKPQKSTYTVVDKALSRRSERNQLKPVLKNWGKAGAKMSQKAFEHKLTKRG